MANLFSESTQVSMMRVLSFMSLVAAIVLAYQNKPGFEVFVMAAFGGKVAQKFAEVKQNG